MLLLILSGCKNNKLKTIDLSQETISKDSFVFSNENGSDITINEYEIPLPEHAESFSFSFYDDVIYYVIDYSNYLEPKTEKDIKDPKIFKSKYNTEILSYNTITKQIKTIYKYNENYCVNVHDIVCNDNYLVWDELSKEGIYSIKMISIENNIKNIEPKTILTSKNYDMGYLDTFRLRITDDKLYWHQAKENKEKTELNCSVYQYSFKNNEINKVLDNLSLGSPYEIVSIDNKNLCSFTRTDNTNNIIHITNLENGNKTDVFVSTPIVSPVSNGKIIAWSDSYEASRKLYYYNIETSELNVLNNLSIFSYNIINNKIIFDYRDEKGISNISGYDIQKKMFYNLTNNNQADITYLTLYKNSDDSIIVEKAKLNKHILINIK